MLDVIAQYARILKAGEAKDFCVKESMIQMLRYFGTKHPDALKRVTFLDDCTSRVFPNKKADELFLVRQFDYKEFKNRLS